MSDKPRIRRDQIVSEAGQKLAYVDDGGTLRHTVKSKVEIVEGGGTDAGNVPADPAATVETVSKSADTPTDSAPVEVPPSSDTPAPGPTPAAASDAAAQQPKASRKREKTMATQTATATKKNPAKAPPKAKAAAKKAPAKRVNGTKASTESTGIRTIAGKAVDLSHYEKTKAPGGGTSYHNGDAVAEKLAGKSLDDAYVVAAKTLKVDEKELRKQYAHLNVGMQRMSLGNRMRKVLIPKAARTN
jgi:hypothetical protein